MFPACRTADEPFTSPPFALTRSDIESFLDARRGFHPAFRACFPRQEPRDHFFHSLVGQGSALERQSIAPRALHVEGGTVRAMPRLVRAALWDADARLETSHSLVQAARGAPDGVLSVAEPGFANKGHASVGGARPYGGALGQVEHGQVGVLAASAARQGYARVDQRRCLPEPWFTDADPARRTTAKRPAEVPWQRTPQWAAALVQALHQAGRLPGKDMVAAGLYGTRPDGWAAGAACVGPVAGGATPAATRGWPPPLATTTHTATSKGERRPQRGAVTDKPSGTGAALAHAIPAPCW
jgi:SRSO17 transposase